MVGGSFGKSASVSVKANRAVDCANDQSLACLQMRTRAQFSAADQSADIVYKVWLPGSSDAQCFVKRFIGTMPLYASLYTRVLLIEMYIGETSEDALMRFIRVCTLGRCEHLITTEPTGQI